MYGELMKTQSEEEDEVKYNDAQSANYSVMLERGEGNLMKVLLMKKHMVLVRVTCR